MKTVDITPSWRGILPLLVEVAANGESAEGRKAALDELLRLADIVDTLQAMKDTPEDTRAARQSEIAMAAGAPVYEAQREAAESQLPDDWPVMIDTSTARRADELDGVLR